MKYPQNSHGEYLSSSGFFSFQSYPVVFIGILIMKLSWKNFDECLINFLRFHFFILLFLFF